MSNEPIRIPQMKQFVDALRKATEDKTGEQQVKAANWQTGRLVRVIAYREASNKMERSAARSLTPTKAMTAVRVAGGGWNTPYFGGANFGAHRNRIRLIKAPVIRTDGSKAWTKRTRATMVRDGEDIDKVVKRVESQYVDIRGRNIGKRLGGNQVKLARTKSGAVRKIKGWNQFRKWERNKDYFLYKSIKNNYEKIVEFYFAALGDAVNKVFPDN